MQAGRALVDLQAQVALLSDDAGKQIASLMYLADIY